MKKVMVLFCAMISLVVCTACAPKFEGTRRSDNKEFCLEFQVLNTTERQDLSVETKESIRVRTVVDQGSVSIRIQKDKENPVYEGNSENMPEEFIVEIEEGGTYTVEVSGKNAQGSVCFTVEH